MKNRILSFFAAGLMFASAAQAQIIKCVSDETYAETLAAHPEVAQLEKQANDQARQFLGTLNKVTVVRYIPVVFHVIHNYGNENISQDQINDAIRVLNEDYRKVAGTNGGSSTDILATDMGYEFRLAQIDPMGRYTDGVNRIQSALTENANDNVKALSYWPSDKYLNIWVVRTIKNSSQGTGTILGYAQFPWTRSVQPTTDGIVVRSDNVGAILYGDKNQVGRTLTHEVGHWLGLYHTFQSGCGSASSNCNTQGDQVCDTPPAAAANYGCNTTTNSCHTETPDVPDQVRNYMDYADGTCMNMFTTGQKTRVDAIVATYRSLIYSANNLANAGINNLGGYNSLSASTSKAAFHFDFNVPNLGTYGFAAEAFNINPDTAWKLNNSVGHSDTRSIYIRNFLTQRLNTRASFTTSNYDMTGVAVPVVDFKIAYAKRLTASNDKLLVYVSNTFGRTETLARTFSAADMESVPMQGSEFTPAGPSHWKTLSVDLSAYSTYTNLTLRFEFQNLRGNNVYVDDISIGTPTGTAELLKHETGFGFFPNPMHESATVRFTALQGEQVRIALFDLSGRVVKTIADEAFGSGHHDLNVSKDGLGIGLYILKFESTRGSFNAKVLVN